jgi:RNA polymerase sigma-70 factor (ECF subfamily)
LLQTAFNITGNREDAEDAVQDSLMRAFVRINDFRGASSFATWLTRIVINSSLMIRRKSRTALYVFLDDASEDGEHRWKLDVPCAAADPAQALVAREHRKALRKAIARLQPSLRSVIEAAHLKDLSMKETARVLNISIGAAKARLFQARAALRRSAALRVIAPSRTEPAA